LLANQWQLYSYHGTIQTWKRISHVDFSWLVFEFNLERWIIRCRLPPERELSLYLRDAGPQRIAAFIILVNRWILGSLD